VSDDHKRNAKIIADAIAQLEKDPDGMALAFLNVYLHSKPKREQPDLIFTSIEQAEAMGLKIEPSEEKE
tara:strand:+ start:5839 stop:6045 length:207 start_codon:yes stop_codon:yes gene_type:complete